MPVILATQEAEMRKIAVQNQLGQIVHETLSQQQQKKFTKIRASGVGQGVGLEFKPHIRRKKNQKNPQFEDYVYLLMGSFYVMLLPCLQAPSRELLLALVRLS
jgi:hypothetical protein